MPDLGVGRVHDGVDDPRLQIQQDGAGNVVLVICLVEEHVLPICALCGVVLQGALRRDSMLAAKFLPELKPNWKYE